VRYSGSTKASEGLNYCVDRQQSVFAARTQGGGYAADAMPAAGPCGACGDPRGPGACSMN